MLKTIPTLTKHRKEFIAAKETILKQWVSYTSPKEILALHEIDEAYFIEKYASGVFDYFMGVISGDVEIGNCPVMQELLAYLKFREIGADELFEICTHFRRSMVDVSYDNGMNSKELFDEISYLFDKNFRGILKFYTDTIFQKLIDARQEAIRAGQAKEYFLSNMSHEIRTPLNAILGFVNLLIDEDLSKKHRNYLEIILNSGENLLSIINDILDFSKLRSGEFIIEPKVFSIHDELSHTMELFVASANAKDITITSFINPKIPRELYGDALRIKQIISNFISNAIKFTPEGGIIEIEASYEKSILKISVSDNGVGIDVQDLKKVFNAFVQAESGDYQNIEGTGLGLSISYQLAELMNGKVEVASVLGQGSTFWMEIPIEIANKECKVINNIDYFQKLKMALYAKDNVLNFKHESFLKYAEIFGMDISVVDTLESDFDICIFVHEDVDIEFKKEILTHNKRFVALMSKEYDDYEKYLHINSLCFPLYCSKIHTIFNELMNPEEYAEYEKKISKNFKGHVLVAEDNEANQELIKIILAKYGLTFDIAKNGLEAFEFYKKNSYDLVLMDEQMPIMDGIESVKKIIEYEENEGLSHTPISALTANVMKGAKERGLLVGFDAFLGKPIVLKELERVFSSYLRMENVFVEKKPAQEKEKSKKTAITGLDADKLTKELMLTQDELVLLLSLFIKKMETTLPELKEAIDAKEYRKIALKAHSIKGSSGNFRIEELLKNAAEMEKMAKSEEREYDYEHVFQTMEEKIASIKIG
ncbi:hybrid sensor histidine kinase/response regulator [Sulfurimonas paralvinellae]|uniref:Sensory/regulatory protein RpfC n=1 Tax=Sulfurimonas paralvinellae TaxID=317658 RepID=A0A7M1B8R2_9BACT|nr:ATP-binding protein [Sulfurimonas paralvinellae]QOP46094.1 response regulator [Sulfurimonas paralvinellae]